MPKAGELVVPRSPLTAVSGNSFPALAGEGFTLFLVTWAGCEACKRDLSTYPSLLRDAERLGIATRWLVVPSSAAETTWFLSRASSHSEVVLDSVGISYADLRAKVTPSALLADGHGIVKASFSPSLRNWPVTQEALIQSLRPDRPGS